MEGLMEKLKEAKAFIESKTQGLRIEAGLVLGSGLGDLADEIKDPVIINYKDIPNFPVSTVQGHAGRLVIGSLQGKNVMCMQGRFHYYEGYGMDQVVFPIQVMRLLGIEYLILTNAAGCVNVNWEPGTLMMITDHIKFAPECPMRGPNADELGVRFFDMTRAYDPELQKIVRKEAEKLGIPLKEGVYMFFSGPNYETPAEIRAARVLGADAAGMSTVPEAVFARACGIKVAGLSLVSNLAAGISRRALGHEEVMAAGEAAKPSMAALIGDFIDRL